MPSAPVAVRHLDLPTSRLRTHVLVAGPDHAPILVLVHGNVSSARFFAPSMSVLAGRYRCIAPDLRGFGLSEAAGVDARRGVRDFADDLHALLTESALVPGGQRVHLLGWSLGGGVVLQYAIDHPGTVASIVLESPMSPFGFGGTRDLAGVPCWPDFAGSGGGTASPEMVRRIAGGDRGTDDPASPRNVLTTLYGKPPFQLPAGLEDELVDAMLQMATGDDNYPGDAVVSPNWPGTAPGERGRQQRDLAAVLRRVRIRGDRRPARRAVDPRRQRPDRVRHLSRRPGLPRADRRGAGLARRRRLPAAADGRPDARHAGPLPRRGRTLRRARAGRVRPLARTWSIRTSSTPSSASSWRPENAAGRAIQELPRSTAPVRRAASATAASLAAVTSSAVSVRSGARNRSVYASDLLPSPACSPV